VRICPGPDRFSTVSAGAPGPCGVFALETENSTRVDAVRYWLALVTVMTLPPAIAHWLIVHPFVRVWRRAGSAVTYAVVFLVFAACGWAIFRARDWIMQVDYGTDPWLWLPAAACYGLAAWIQIQVRRHLRFRILVGLPELDPSGHGGKLLDEGPYARVRHPRYVAVLLGIVAAALFTDFLATYILIPVTAAGLAAIAWFEERELASRFGAGYEEYRRRVPMFIPRLGSD